MTTTYPLSPGLHAPAEAHVSAGTRVLGYAILADLTILPYFPLLIMPFSLGIVVLWAVCRLEVRFDRDLGLLAIIAACVLLSVAASVFFRDQSMVVANIKRAGQFLTSFAYYFFFRRLARDARFDPRPVLTLFMVYLTVWVLFFMASPFRTTAFSQRMYVASAYVGESNLIFMRFAYMFSDPNHAAYLIAIVGMFLMTYRRPSATRMVLALVMMSLCVVATGSRGAALALLIALPIWVWRRGIIGRYAFRFAIAAMIALLVGVYGFRSYAAKNPEKIAAMKVAYDMVVDRITGGGEQTIEEVLVRGETSAGENRLATWRVAVTSLKPLPLGRGYELTYGEGNTLRPHSDVLRFLYSYGFIGLIAAWWFFFRDLWRFELEWPALMAFGVNSLIDEQKLLCVYLALLAIVRVEEKRGGMSLPDRRPRRRVFRILTRRRATV